MNNPNPFIPQGSMLEQKNKKRARVKIAVLAIFACNILLVGPLVLLNGCRRSDQSSNDGTGQDTPAVAADTGAAPALPAAPMAGTNGSNAELAVAPAPAPVPVPMPPPPTPTVSDYTVVKGDTMGSIATKFHVKLKDLETANPTVVPTKMAYGIKLKIPEATMATATSAAATDSADLYRVKPGDNLTIIAKAHGTTVKELETLNNLKSSAIKAGEKLKLPEKSATASTPIPTPSTPTADASNLSSGARPL